MNHKPSEGATSDQERARASEVVDAMGRDIGEDKVLWPETWRRRIATALAATRREAERAGYERGLEEAARLVKPSRAFNEGIAERGLAADDMTRLALTGILRREFREVESAIRALKAETDHAE